MQDTAISFRLGVTAAHKIIIEVSDAIWDSVVK